MQELKVIDEKGLKDVLVFQLCECDAVAAYSLDEARDWYKAETGLSDDELYPYDEVEVVSPDHKIYKSEDCNEMMTVRESLDIYWEGQPYIVFTTGL